jgi:competence protein ComEC
MRLAVFFKPLTALRAVSGRLAAGSRRAWEIGRQTVQDGLKACDKALAPLSEWPLYALGAGLLGGSIIGHTVPLSPGLILGLGLAAIACLSAWPYAHMQRCWRLIVVGMLLTHALATWQGRAVPDEHIARLLAVRPGKPVTVVGLLDRPVEVLGTRQRLYVRVSRVRYEHTWYQASGRVRINVHADTVPFMPGDIVQVSRVRLYPPRGFWNPGGFDLQRYLTRRGIFAIGGVSKANRVRLLEVSPGWQVARWFEAWRQTLRTRVRAHLESPYDTVLLALVLGDRGSVPDDVRGAFQQAGAAHLLVVSGLHVGFVAAACLFAWRWLLRLARSWLPPHWLPGWRPTPTAALLSLPMLLVYCTLVGWKVPTTRAALMIGSSLLALMLQRRHELPHALALAASLIVILDPAAPFSVGFQLSFVAVGCILLAVSRVSPPPPFSGILQRWRRRVQLYVVVSTAAFLGTGPILAATFHTIPSFGIVTNLLAVPLAALVVPLGVVALGGLTLWPAAGAVIGSGLQPLITALVALVQEVAGWPGGQWHLAAPSAPMIVGSYGLLVGFFLPVMKRWRVLLAGCCVVLVVGGGIGQYLATRARDLRVTFLDVGSGDAILVQAPGNHALLVDGGGTYDGRFDIGARVIAPVLWDRWIRRFDLVAMTHPQVNHARGLVSVLRLFPSAHLLTNGTPLTADYLRELLRVARRRGTRHHRAPEGPRRWRWGKLQVTVLAPPEAAEQRRTGWQPSTENDRSLVLRLQYGRVRVLLTGDIHQATERWLVRHRRDLRADVLHIPHHGSKTSTSPAFVRRVRPAVGIISLGAGNPYGHPRPQVLETLAAAGVEVYRTDYHGAITVTSDGWGYRITPFRPYRPGMRGAPSADSVSLFP